MDDGGWMEGVKLTSDTRQRGKLAPPLTLKAESDGESFVHDLKHDLGVKCSDQPTRAVVEPLLTKRHCGNVRHLGNK